MYVIRNEASAIGKIISVIIETKHVSNKATINHVVAQVIGHFAAFNITPLTLFVNPNLDNNNLLASVLNSVEYNGGGECDYSHKLRKKYPC